MVEPFAVEGAAAEAVAEESVLAVGLAYPNPARGHAAVPVRLSAPSEVEVGVRRAGAARAGAPAEALEAGTHALALEVGGLPSGVYLVRVVAQGEAAVTQRLVVAR